METEISVLSMQSYPCLIYFHHLWMPLVLNILAALNDCIHITKFQVLKEGIGQTFLPDIIHKCLGMLWAYLESLASLHFLLESLQRSSFSTMERCCSVPATLLSLPGLY